MSNFNFDAAQKYELNFAQSAMRDDFLSVYVKWEECVKHGGLWQDASNQWFQGDTQAWDTFVEYVRHKKCLEVGSGPFGFLAPCYWLKDRVIIEPLIDEYRKYQLDNFNKTFFSPDIKTYPQVSEDLLDELVGKVDGFIVCRNALDHCKDPIKALINISMYASSGCYLLLWTDIWHLDGLDEGHSNITRNPEELDNLLISNGFTLVREGQKIRDPNQFIEYGRLFRKK
jgi:hypothetical protein